MFINESMTHSKIKSSLVESMSMADLDSTFKMKRRKNKKEEDKSNSSFQTIQTSGSPLI
jgi:hypothetical protein